MSEDNRQSPDQDAMADEWAAALEEQEATTLDPDEGEASETPKRSPSKQKTNDRESRVKEANFAVFSPDDPIHDDDQDEDKDDVSLDVVLDIPVTLSIEIGRTRVPIRNLLQLNQGSVVELDRLAGEPLDVFVNGTLIAHGEVVVVNEKFGIRLTDVISPTERIKKLK